MSSYDDGEITDREQKAADNQNNLANYNTDTLKEVSNYNMINTNKLDSFNQQVIDRLANFNQANTDKLATFNKNNATTLRDYNKSTANNTAAYNRETQDKLATYNRNTTPALANHNAEIQKQIAQKNAQNTTAIAQHNANAVKDQVQRQLENYESANKQNASLRDVQLKQASRKSEAERFEAQRNLQNAALGLFGSMNQAMNGSTIGNTMHMLRNRNDSENTNYWQQLADNRNAVLNAYDESYNQNQIAKRDATINALKAIRDIQGDLSSNLNNVQGDLNAHLGNINSDLLASLSSIESDLYTNKRNIEGDRYTNVRGANADWYNNYGNIEGDRFTNYNNSAAEEYNSLMNQRGEAFKARNQIWGDQFTNLRNIQGDLSANLNNINPNLYHDPYLVGGESGRWVGAGEGEGADTARSDWGGSILSSNLPRVNDVNKVPGISTTNLSNMSSLPSENLDRTITLPNGYKIPASLANIAEIANGSIYKNPTQNTALNNIYDLINSLNNGITENRSVLDDYIMPANAEQNVQNYRNRLRGNDYFSNLINGFNY